MLTLRARSILTCIKSQSETARTGRIQSLLKGKSFPTLKNTLTRNNFKFLFSHICPPAAARSKVALGQSGWAPLLRVLPKYFLVIPLAI